MKLKIFKSYFHFIVFIFSAAIGFIFLFLGIAMLVLPGPGILFIILGLFILSGHFIWARVLLKRVKRGARSAQRGIERRVPQTKRVFDRFGKI